MSEYRYAKAIVESDRKRRDQDQNYQKPQEPRVPQESEPQDREPQEPQNNNKPYEAMIHIEESKATAGAYQSLIEELSSNGLSVSGSDTIKTNFGRLSVLKIPVTNHEQIKVVDQIMGSRFGSAFKKNFI